MDLEELSILVKNGFMMDNLKMDSVMGILELLDTMETIIILNFLMVKN